MNWFKKKYSVCSECGVHFEPVTGYEERWGNLCAAHRKSVKDRDEKRDAVIEWAFSNWERLSNMMEEENKKQREEYNKIMQNNIAAYMNMQQTAQSSMCQGLQQTPWGM